MRYNIVELSKTYPILDYKSCFLKILAYEPTREYGLNYRRPAVVICAGGAYAMRSAREAEPVAFRYLSEGFNAFILEYSVKTPWPRPQIEVGCAIDYIRTHKDELCLNDNILLVGFSAGGNLASSYSLKYKEIANLIATSNDLKPTELILGYPVVSLVNETHEMTSRIISGGDPEIKDKLSAELHLDSDFPATYVWHTDCDSCVPVSNTYRLIEALKKAKVPYDYDIFSGKNHGASLCTMETNLSYNPVTDVDKKINTWVNRSIEFFHKVKKQ